jgi:hypothetical protein
VDDEQSLVVPVVVVCEHEQRASPENLADGVLGLEPPI